MQLNSCAQARGNKPWLASQIVKVMKLTALLITIACLHVSAKVFSQISLSGKNVALSAVFTTIQKQSGYAFFYKDKIVENIKVNPDLHNVTLEQALDQVLKDLPLTYNIVDKTVVIKQVEPSFFDNLKNKIKEELAQLTVTGRVVDEFGQPLAGVTVKVKNTTTATATDLKGAFSITAPDNNAILVFSYVGYETKELGAKNLAEGQVITLIASVTNLREVAINKGYYTERQELLTGNVSVVDGKTIAQQPGINPIDALEGRVAGLYISQSSGIPGESESTINIRGRNSIANGNHPLFIVDGLPFGSASPSNPGVPSAVGLGNLSSPNVGGLSGISPFALLNPSDIENIEVLKDADATAIYGSRGANGVILITTKKGKAGDTKVNVDLSQGIGQVSRFMSLMNTPQYLQMRHEALKNDGLSPDPTFDFDLTNWDTTRNTNWQKVLIGNTAHYTNTQGSVSGGTENTQFYIGGGYKRQTTVFPGDYSDQQGSLHFTLNHSSVNKRFNIQFSGTFLNDNSNLPGVDFTSTALTLAPDAPPLYSPNGSLNWQTVGGTATWGNPLAATYQHTSQVTNSLTSNLQLSYRIMPGLTIKSNFGYTDVAGNQSEQTPSTYWDPPADNNDPSLRSNHFGNTEIKTWIIEPQISYDQKIGKGLLSALIGTTFQQSLLNSDEIDALGFSSDALITNPLSATIKVLNGYNTTQYRYNSLYARLNYTWDGKYLFNVTARRDGSSRFGPANEYGNFGAIGAGWIFTKEKTIADDLPWLSFGKLRGSYGLTGNDQITDYQYLSTYSTFAPTYQGTTGLSPTRIPNPYYGWETDKKLEGGADLGFLKDRINLTVAYFINRTGNQLVGYPLPSITGFATVQENLPAVVQNTGIEFDLQTTNVNSTGFTWTTAFNLTIPRNKLVSYPGLATSNYANTYEVGQPLSIQKVYHYLDIDPQTGIVQYASSNGPTANPSSSDEIFSKPITQQFYGGFQNSFKYKNFQLDVFIQFVKQTGYNYLKNTDYYAGLFNNNYPTAILDHWQKPGDVVPYGKYSTQFAADPNSLYYVSDATIGDASFIRLKNVALSYQLPKSWQQSVHMQSGRIYLQAQNLLTLTHYFGPDPETQGLGLPPLRMITAGVSASF